MCQPYRLPGWTCPGRRKTEVGVSLNVSQSPDFFYDDGEEVLDENFAFPNLELTGRYGVSDKFDVGVKLNTNLNLSITTKYQFLGDRQSKAAMAIGADVGTFGIISSLWNAQLPLYFSLHHPINLHGIFRPGIFSNLPQEI